MWFPDSAASRDSSHYFFLPGPAKYQIISPSTGKIRINNVHKIFAIRDALLWNTFMIAQISAIRINNPMIVLTMFYPPLK
jgi:hypothetical protein